MRRNQRGSGLIEFSLLILTLMLLALGVFDFGLALEQGIVVSAAAHVGAQYGVAEGNANDTVGMQNAANRAGASVLGFSATATTWCVCSDGSSSTIACTSLCNTYDKPIQYVQVQTSATVPVLFRFAGLPVSIPLSGISTLRAR